MRLTITPCLTLLLALVLASAAVPGQTTWTGAANSAWNASANWTNGAPTPTSNVDIPAGTPNSPSTAGVAGAACQNLTIATGATLTVPGGSPLDVHGHPTIDGIVGGGGVVQLVGSFAIAIGGSGQMNVNLVIAAVPGTTIFTSGITTLALNGNLTMLSGNLGIGPGGIVFAVNGNATFQGGVLAANGIGTLDVSGNVAFAGTTVTVAPFIRCGGNWTSDAAFAPTSAGVVFDGSGAQSVSTVTPFADLTIASGASVSLPSLAVTLNLVVAGSLSVSGVLDVDQNLTVAPSGSLTLGAATHLVGGSFANDGGLSASGTIVFDSPSTVGVGSIAPMPNVQVAKPAGFSVVMQTALSIAGNLSVVSGSLHVGPGGIVVSVSGNGVFQGGALVANGLGTVDVGGNVTFSGTTVTTSPGIRCAGNWTADAAFAPTGGLPVELDGVSPTTISHATPGGTLTFHDLVIKNGVRTFGNDVTIAASSITIDSGGTLAVTTGRHPRVHRTAGPTAFNANGALSVAANGDLSLGPQTTLTVGATGSLGLVGAAGQPARLTGEAGGGYGVTINGTIAANQFVVKEMNQNGLLVDFGATIAPAPNDFRNGTFDFRAGAPAGSVLLDMRRQAPAGNFDALAFLNTPGAAGVFNVKSAAPGVPISFTNWTGPLAGPAFENDPGSLVAWNLQPGPTLGAFVVLPGADLTEIIWNTISQANVTGWQIRRAGSAAGPYSVVLSPAAAGTSYGVFDQPLPANVPQFYLLHAVMSGGDVLFAGGVLSATPYSSATPGNVKKVGGSGTFATIQDAITAATDPNSVVWVTPGTYDSFTIGATAVPSNLRILGDGTGPVNISTLNGPIQILNVPGSSGVELSNLFVGAPSTAQNGIVVSNCASPVILDQVDVACDGVHTAISVSASPAMAIQRSNLQGGTGLSVSNGSYVAVSRGSLSSLVSTASTVEISTLTPGSVSVTPPSSLIARTGVMPEINLPEFISLSAPSALFLDAQPNAPFVIGASPRLGLQAGGPGGFEMPFLLDAVALALLPTMFTDGLGQAAVGFEVSPIAALLGFSFTVQVVVGDPITGVSRLSNVESMVCVP